MRYDIDKLVGARMKKGWNQTTLAYKAGLSVATVSYVECGKRSTPAAVAKMAEALGLNIAKLVIKEDDGDLVGAATSGNRRKKSA